MDDLHIELTVDMALGGKLECTLTAGSADDRPHEYQATRKGSLEDLFSEEISRWTVSETEARALLAELDGATLSPMPPPEPYTYLDGWTSHLKITRHTNVVEYSWRCDLPPQWRCFQPLLTFFGAEVQDGDPKN